MSVSEIIAWVESVLITLGLPITMSLLKSKDKKHARQLEFEKMKIEKKHEKAVELEQKVIELEKRLDSALSEKEVTGMQWASIQDLFHILSPVFDDLADKHPSMGKPLKATIKNFKKYVNLDPSHLNEIMERDGKD